MTSIDETSLRDSFDSDRLHLPRDMSERALKNLEVSFVTSLKKLEDASKGTRSPIWNTVRQILLQYCLTLRK